MSSETSPVLAAAERLFTRGCHLFFRHGRRFHDPLVPAQWERLRGDPVLSDAAVLSVLDLLVDRLPELHEGIYSPVPIARALAEGVETEVALGRFRYEPIRVDDRQRWWWQGREVADRLRRFFLAHLGWEPSYPLWFFEYRVSEDWFDKSYLRCAVSPLRIVHLESTPAGLVGRLECGREVVVRADGLDLDRAERLFATTEALGPALVSESLRFRLLSRARDDLLAVEVDGSWIPLRWPEGGPPRPEGAE